MADESNVGMADYVAALRRRRKLMLGVILSSIVLAALIAFALPNVYRATGYFRLRDTSPESIHMSFSDQYVFNLRDYVLSDANKRKLVEQLQPYPQYRDNPDASAWLLGKNIHVDMQTSSILDAGGHNQNINSGFTVSFDHENPRTAVDVARWLSDGFVAGGRQDALEHVASELKFFAAEGDRLGAKVAEVEARVADFKRHNFETLPESAQANLMAKNQAEQELLSLDRELTAQRTNRIYLNSQLLTSQHGTAAGNVSALEDEYQRKAVTYDESHPDMVALRRQIANAKRGGTISADGSLKSELDSQKAILAEARLRYSDDHPDIKRLISNIASLEKRIAAGEKVDPGAGVTNTPVTVQLNSQIHATDTQIASIEARRAALQEKVESADRRMISSPAVEREYELLNRDLGTAKQQYDDLVRKRLEVEISEAAIRGGNSDKFIIASAPGLPSAPFRPNRPLILMIGALAGFAVAFMLAVLAEAIDGTVRGSKDIEMLLGVRPLAVVPEIWNSVAAQRRNRQLTVVAASAAVVIPAAFIVIRLIVR
jgi:polysaccharide biosynthesis transport protein